jgi:membrane protein
MMIRQAAVTSYQIAMETMRGVINHDAVTFASTIAFSLLFALFPFLIMVVLAGTAVLGEARALDLERDLMELLPDYVGKTIKLEVETVLTTRASGGFLTLGALAILVSVSGFVETVRYALNRAYRVEENRSFLYRRTTGLLFALGVTFTLVAVAALGLLVPLALNLATRYAPELVSNFELIEIGRTLIALLLLALLLIALNSLLPAERLKVRSVLPGVFLTLVLLWVFSDLFVVYLTHFSNFGATYGSLAGVIVLMLFFELSALAVIVGAELNRAIADHSVEPDMRAVAEP